MQLAILPVQLPIIPVQHTCVCHLHHLLLSNMPVAQSKPAWRAFLLLFIKVLCISAYQLYIMLACAGAVSAGPTGASAVPQHD